MALVSLKLYSNALQMQTEVNVIIPQKIIEDKKGNKSLYLLHGLSDDQSIWLRRTSIERYAEEYGICVIMPFGGRSFYFDQINGEKYYSYIAKELPQVMRDLFGISDKRENTYIAGISMGGYGALKIALKECDKFCGGAGLSSVANIKTELIKEHLNNLLNGNTQIVDEDDLYRLIEEKENDINKPKLYAWCGTEDFLYEDNVAFKEYVKNFKYEFTYSESEGNHSWSSWDSQIVKVIEWMLDKK